MTLTYRCFGDVAILVRYEKLKVTGEVVTIECDAPEGTRVFLYSDKGKEGVAYTLRGGVAEIPVGRFEGGVRVHFEGSCGTVAYGTPIEEVLVGDERYLVGGAFETREEIKRVQDALVYLGGVVKQVPLLEKRVLGLEERLEQLERRANSGDIINF